MRMSILLALACCCSWVLEPVASARAADPSALTEYVNRPDNSFAWRVRRIGSLGTGQFAELIVTSQRWRNVTWKHQLFIYRPQKLRKSSQAILLIDSGKWNESLESAADASEATPERLRVLAALADAIHLPVAVLRQVPNQPIFDIENSDEIIAFTFSKYLETGESDWPLLLPMVKAVVRGMDAIQEFARQEWQIEIDHFTLTGASKRGWTSWLTAATDHRVNSIAPMVINMLNMGAHSNLQKESFNGFSEKIRPYTNRGLPQEALTRRGTALRAIVDPYAYRVQLLQPKLIILATNDAYWPVDALNLYWNDLPDDKYILFLPNSGHSVEDYPRVVAAIAALAGSLTGGKPLPQLVWNVKEHRDVETIELTTDVEPLSVRLWSSAAQTRDFRKAEWVAKAVSAKGDVGRTFVGELAKPTDGFNAMFLEAEFPGEPLPFKLSTTLHVFSKRGFRESGSAAD